MISCDAVSGLPVSVDIFPMSLTSRWPERPNVWSLSQALQLEQCCVWTLWAPTTQLYIPWDYVMNTDTTLFSF